MGVDRTEWDLREVAAASVAPMIIASHYLHKMPGVVPCALALSVNGWVMGALVWALPPRETKIRYGAETWELARLWLADELPKNSETWVISKGLKHLSQHHPEVKFAISYADPTQGHDGTIYKASNWTYEGMTDSERKSPRKDYYLNGRRLGRKSHANGAPVERVPRVPKHRFIYKLKPYGHQAP